MKEQSQAAPNKLNFAFFRFFGSIVVSGGESVIKFNISWFQNKSDGSARIVFQFFNRPNVTTSISASKKRKKN